MPGEDTNELMKLRAVQGELPDLPEDNPRATLSSRIRALLLRITGLPQLIHDYGTLALNKTITLATSEDNCHGLFSDGTYLYAGLYTTPGKIVKIDLSDFTTVSTLTLATGENNCHDLLSDGTYLYVSLDTAPGKIVRINLADFTIDSTITLAAGSGGAYPLTSDGSYLYVGTVQTPARVVRINLADFTIDSTITLAAGENQCRSLISDGSYLYAGLYTIPGKIVKIDLSDFTTVSTLTLAVGENQCQCSFSDGSYLYAGLYMSPGKIVKIDLATFTKMDGITLAVGEDICRDLFSDGRFLYAGLSVSPGKIVKLDLSDFTTVSTLTLAAGENLCRSIFSDSLYLYSGLNTSPAKIVRHYIYPTNATLRESKIDRTYERQVEQSMPLAMYGKVTTYTDTTHFKMSTLSGQFGNDFFNNWYVYVVRDAGGAGAAPQGEAPKPISDYTSSDGTFVHTAFTVPLAVGDEVLILQEAIASVITSSTTVNNIFDLVNAILTLTETGGTITTNGALQTLYINNTPAGIFQPRKLLIDFTNHAIGDVMIIRTYYRINPAGGLIKQDEESIVGPRDPATITIYLEDNRFGYEVTIEKTVGADLTYDWGVIYKA